MNKPSEVDIPWNAYFERIETLKGVLSPELYEYARDQNHYNLTSHSSLHDAWLNDCTISEPAQGSNHEERTTEIRLSFLGPFHDKVFNLTYKGVNHYSITSPTVGKGHGDLLIHKFDLGENGHIIHELIFDSEARITISFSGFQYQEESK